MPLWGSVDQANNSPKFGAELISVGSGNAAKASNTTAMFSNTTPGAFVAGKAVGQFSVSVSELANTTGESKKINHAGWQLRTAFTGPVSSYSIVDGGTGYANTDTISVSGGTTNATATIVTDVDGVITSVVPVLPGEGFPNVASANVAITTSAGTGADVEVTLGGRAGRVQYETLVAAGFTSNGTADDTQLPQ